MRKSYKTLFVACLLSCLLVSCAGVSPVVESVSSGSAVALDPEKLSNPAGFWTGLWHGWTAVFAIIAHLFNHNIAVYETYNSGAWYDFGFLVGVGAFSGGSASVRR